MRSRLALYLDDLTLDEILYFDEELDRRKEKYRRQYTVLSVQCDRSPVKGATVMVAASFARDFRKFIVENAAVGGGTLLGFSPEVSVLLFVSAENASRTCSSLVANLAEFNGRGGKQPYSINLKLGAATGLDVLSPGSVRCMRESVLVKRANQCAWKCPPSQVLMDESTHKSWPLKFAAVRMPFDLDTQHIYKVTPGTLGAESDRYDNQAITIFLDKLAGHGITLVNYDLVHSELHGTSAGSWSKPVDVTQLHLQAFDPTTGQNLNYTEKIASADFSNRMEIVKRMMSSVGLALVRHEFADKLGA